jgi:hypothetical protein
MAAAMVLAAAAVLSCAGGPSPVSGGPGPVSGGGQTIPGSGEGLFTLYSRRESIPGGGVSANLRFTLVDAARSGALQRTVRKLFYRGRSPEAYVQGFTADWNREYRRAAAEWTGTPASGAWEYEEAQYVTLASPFAVIHRNVSVYQGGAHPNWHEDAYILDLASSRRLLLKDVIAPEALPRLRALTDRELRRFSQLRTGRALPEGAPFSAGIYLEDEIPPSEDFYPDRNGLNFQWDPYEIAPYVVGGVEVNIRWKELADLLSPRGKALAAAFTR